MKSKEQGRKTSTSSNMNMIVLPDTNVFYNLHLKRENVPECSRRLCHCDINTVTVMCQSLPSIPRPNQQTKPALGGLKDRKREGKKSKAIDINDLLPERSPQA